MIWHVIIAVACCVICFVAGWCLGVLRRDRHIQQILNEFERENISLRNRLGVDASEYELRRAFEAQQVRDALEEKP